MKYIAVLLLILLTGCSNKVITKYVYIETPKPLKANIDTQYTFYNLKFNNSSFYCIDDSQIDNFILDISTLRRVYKSNYNILEELYNKSKK